jgi:hypothetical protein
LSVVKLGRQRTPVAYINSTIARSRFRDQSPGLADSINLENLPLRSRAVSVVSSQASALRQASPGFIPHAFAHEKLKKSTKRRELRAIDAFFFFVPVK